MIAALFPGQGSQALGMAEAFYRHSHAAKAVLDEAERALPGLLEIMWQGPSERLTQTAHQQPALVAAGAAAFAAYREAGGEPPRYAAGHSLGEFTAHVAAGTLPIGEAIRLVHKRGRYMQEAVPEGQGAMAAILKIGAEQVADVCRESGGVVDIANYNSPEQTVISGERGAVLRASTKLKDAGARVIPLKVSAPFHCRLMKRAAERLAQDLAHVNFQPAEIPVISNVTAQLIDTPQDASRLLVEQVTAPVRWRESLQQLASLGVTRFIEFGSGKVLTGLVRRSLEQVQAIPVSDLESLKEAL